MTFALLCAILLPLAATCAPSVYDESAFPVATRAAEAARLADALARAKAAAAETDRLVARACARLPRTAFERVRFAKRREVRARTRAFAARYLVRGDATGLGFAEQAIADLELMDRILREEAANLANNPRYARRPVVLALADFGAAGDGRADDAPAFARACEAVRRLGGRPSRLKLGAGAFRFATAAEARGLCNCSIEGEGTGKTRLAFADYDKPGLVFFDCTNCALRKVECACDQVPFTEGKVLSVRRDGETCAVDIALTPGALRPDATSWDPPYTWGVESFGFEFAADGALIQGARLIHWDSRDPKRCRDLGAGKWRLFFRRGFDPDNFDHHLTGLVVGGYLAMPNRCNAFPTLRVSDCRHQLIEDVWVSSSRAGAIDAYARSYMTSFHRFRVAPRPGFHLATDADGCFCAPGTFLYDSSFEAMGDDGMNSLSNITRVRVEGDGRTVRREREWGSNPKGSLVVFFDPATGRYLANRRVAAADEPGRMTTVLDRAVPPGVDGAVMIAPRFRGIGTVVSNCRWRHGRWTGIVIQTPDALVEDCTFDNIHQEAVRMCFYGDWNEGLPPYNVLVRNCRVANGEKGVVTRYQHHDAQGRPVRPGAAPMRAIDVVGCRFKNLSDAAFALENAAEVQLASNAFENVAREWTRVNCE